MDYICLLQGSTNKVKHSLGNYHYVIPGVYEKGIKHLGTDGKIKALNLNLQINSQGNPVSLPNPKLK